MSVREHNYGIVGVEMPYQKYDNDLDMNYGEKHKEFLEKHNLVCVEDAMSGKYTIIGRMVFYNNSYARSYDPDITHCHKDLDEVTRAFVDVFDAVTENKEVFGVDRPLMSAIKLHIFTHYT